MLTFLKRLFLVPIGFVFGAIATLAVLLSLGSEHVTHAMAGREEVPIAETFEVLRQAAVLASAMTLVPAIVLVIIGEVARIRSALYYVIGGGAALAAVPLISRMSEAGPLMLPGATVWQIFATAGFVGGFVYWLIAGRGA